MKNKVTITIIPSFITAMRCLKITVVLLLLKVGLYAQSPVIHSISPNIAATGKTVTILGSGFGNNAANLVVHLGAANGTILSASDQVLEVKVPPGASFEKIVVTNISTGLSAFSNHQFLLSYGGDHPMNPANLQTQVDFDASPGLYDLCLCDLDGDGKNDIASVNDQNVSNSISLFRNTSAVGTLSFVKTTTLIGARTLHIRCGDLNGDGKQDLVISEGGNGSRIFILKNNSSPGTLSFNIQTITLTGKKPKQIEIADLDLDGKPELVVTDQNNNGSVIVIPNNSTTGAISMGAPVSITVNSATTTDGLAVEDVNDDNLPDIIVNQFLSANSNIFVLANNSTVGNFRFDTQVVLTVPGTIVNLRVGDMDGDGKPDIATTQLLNSGITILRNQGTGQTVQFAAGVNFLTDIQPWGIDFADMDGDGMNDIAVASITKKSVTLLNNTSAVGNLNFQPTIVGTTFINRHIKMADLDGDGKPEIAFTSIDDNNLGIPASKISIIRNKSCFVPKIDPPGPVTICSTFPLDLTSSESAGVTFDWKQNGGTVQSSASNTYTVSASGQYTVTAIGEGGACTKTSNAVDVTVVASGSVTAPVISSNSPVCISDQLDLSVSSTGADGFAWTGPAGYTASGANVTRSNFMPAFAGRYDVDVKIGTCVAAQGSIVVETVTTPAFMVNFAGSATDCSGGKNLLVSPSSANFTYQWFEQSAGLISGALGTSFMATTSGEYYYEATSILFPSCSAVQSSHTNIVIASAPTAAFNAPAQSCVNTQITFSNQSTVDSQVTPTYLWNFGDGQTSNLASPTHTYTSVQNFSVKLTVTYPGSVCMSEITNPINIVAAPVVTIATPGNVFSFCAGDSLLLQVNGTFTSYQWSTSETTPTIYAKAGGSYSAQVTNAAGCVIPSNSQQVEELAAPVVTTQASPTSISIGESSQLTASGLVNYLWEPEATLSDPSVANPIASPTETTVYTVSGSGTNGCPGEGIIEVNVKGEAIVNRLKPANFFSPNGDAVNQFWTIENILTAAECTIRIFDDKGIKVFEAKPYLNDWDGTNNGRALPNGVYFYIIRCDGEENNPKTGSITLLR